MVEVHKISENVPIELLQKDISISDSEVKTHATLTISEIEGNLFQSPKSILSYNINAKGIRPSLRNSEDGIALFGITNNKSPSYKPDVLLNIPIDKQQELSTPGIFLIYYRRDYQQFYLETVNENKEIYFIFVLLDQPHLLSNETIIVSVQNYNFKIQTASNNKEVNIEYGNGDNLQKIVLNNEHKTIYSIGRKQECDIVLNESEVSREQAIVYYQKGNWYIKDGGKETMSKSGTWLYVETNYLIEHSFVFKIGPSKMKIEYKKKGI